MQQDWIMGLIGGGLIGLSFWWSLRHNRREENGVRQPSLSD